jgi:hypothetical protein
MAVSDLSTHFMRREQTTQCNTDHLPAWGASCGGTQKALEHRSQRTALKGGHQGVTCTGKAHPRQARRGRSLQKARGRPKTPIACLNIPTNGAHPMPPQTVDDGMQPTTLYVLKKRDSKWTLHPSSRALLTEQRLDFRKRRGTG